LFTFHNKEDVKMEINVVNRPGFTVVGMKCHCEGETSAIPELWNDLGARMEELEQVADMDVAYGVSYNVDLTTNEFDYLAGFPVEEVEALPEGLVSQEIPAGEYAVFPCTMASIEETYGQIYGTWLPEAGYRRAEGPDYEAYGEAFDPENPQSEFKVYIPVARF
jgi:AraC family transcriptional regulator